MNVELVFGTEQPNGDQATYLRTNNYNEIFVCWYNAKADKKGNETKEQTIERMIKEAGYTDLTDFWNTKNK